MKGAIFIKSKIINYEIHSDKVKNINITLIGDIHNYYNNYFFKDVIKDIKDTNSDLLLIAGDTTNTGVSWNNKKSFEKIKNMLEDLSENCPVVIIFGNHDILKITKEGLYNFKSLESIKNVFPLYNETVCFNIKNNNVRIDGYVPKKDAYITKANDKKRLIKGNEDEIFENEVNTINSFEKLNEDDFNILLNHDSRIVRFDKIKMATDKYDLITGAHMHNGYIPISYTTKFQNMYDNDYFYFLSKKKTDKKGYVRGVIYGAKDEFVFVDQLGRYYYKNNDTYTSINEKEANMKIKELNCPPIVITAGINKYVGIPIDNPEIVKIKLK